MTMLNNAQEDNEVNSKLCRNVKTSIVVSFEKDHSIVTYSLSKPC